MIKALEFGKEKKWEKVNNEIDKAMEIEPDFYETYKIKAFLEAENGELYKAKNDYDIALSKCMDDKERAYILYLYSIFNTTKMQCMDRAFELLNEAEKLYPDRIEIILEKVRVYSIMGKYDEAEQYWHNANELEKNPSVRTKNIMALRYLDLIRRKAQSMSERDNKEKYNIIKNGIEILDNIKEIDDKTMNMLLRIVSDLSYFYYDNEAMSLVERILSKYSLVLSRVSADIKAKTMKKFIIYKDEIIPKIYSSIIGKLYNYKIDIDKIIDNNKGIVVKLRDGYGFISNKSHGLNNGLFFAMTNAYDDIIVGDIVEFQLYNNAKGLAAKKLKKIGNVFENNECDM